MTFDWKLVALVVAAVAVVAGKGKSNHTDDKQEEKKTLSQQVAEGKYGLIQTELFARRPARPGLLSYERNAEVPRDDENSLGGLGADEIWLAEDHLLVLRGGAFHRTASEMPWQPIDEYVAPGRQVKIPTRPKVPPPFPVQLAEGGPLQYIGAAVAAGEADGARAPVGDGSTTPHPSAHQDPADAAPGRAPLQIPARPGPAPENYPGGNGPGPFPFPPLNQSVDYDDPSIYYPPPYSFYYHADNSTQVPPGPLVPGIVLPPPPDFFGPLENNRNGNDTGTVVLVPHTHRRPPMRYLPYTDNTIQSSTPPPPQPTSISTPLNENDLQEQETPTILTPTTPATDVNAPYPVHRHQSPPSTAAPPTYAPTLANVPVLGVPYKQRTQPKLVSIISIAPKKVATPMRYVTPTVPYDDKPPLVQLEYLQPTRRPQLVHTVSPVTVHYVSYDDRDHRPRTRLKPTSKPRLVHTVPTIVRLPYTRTQVSSSAVPLKNYFSSADVETNSVQPQPQPQVDYYFYEENVTEPPRSRYVQPTNFDRHVHQLRQQIQSFLKPTAKPVYEYSFQAANYQPTSPTPPPYQHQQYVTTNRYQEPTPTPNRAYYPKHGERVLDDITNKYFTTFGQKLTTPVTPVKSLATDTLVNYREPRPAIESDAEFLDSQSVYKKQPGTYISYQLPGEGAHFYFLTPQLVKQQRNLGLQQQAVAHRQYEQQRLEQEQLEQRQRYDHQRYRQPLNPELPYYYSKPNGQKLPRRNER